MSIPIAHFLTLCVSLKSYLLVLLYEMLMEAGLMALLVIDRLQSEVLKEPDELFHYSSGFTELFRATP